MIDRETLKRACDEHREAYQVHRSVAFRIDREIEESVADLRRHQKAAVAKAEEAQTRLRHLQAYCSHERVREWQPCRICGLYEEE